MVPHAILPIAAHPTAWISSHLRAPAIWSQDWNHTAAAYNSHRDTTATTADTSTTTASPDHSVSTLGFPTLTLILIAAGSLVTMVIGLTILFRHLLRRNASPPVQIGYNNQEEEGGLQHEENAEEMRIWRILRKAPHLRTPMERVAADNWARMQDPFQL